MEHISVSGLTFAYGEDGRPHGLCKGDRLFYLTTAGGPILDRNCGFDYLKTLLGNMMDFKKMDYVAAECTDVIGYPWKKSCKKRRNRCGPRFKAGGNLRMRERRLRGGRVESISLPSAGNTGPGGRSVAKKEFPICW